MVASAASRPDRSGAGGVARRGAGAQRGRLRARDARGSTSLRRHSGNFARTDAGRLASLRSHPAPGVGVWAVALGGDPDRRGFGGAPPARTTSIDWWKIRPAKTTKREMALARPGGASGGLLLRAGAGRHEPIAPDASGRSPRLHALNHALLLCPHCPDVHSAVAGTLWALGRRRQALDEWHTAVETRPVVFDSVLQGVWAAGARPEEIAVIAGADPERLIRGSVVPVIPGTTGRGARAAAAGQRCRRPLRAGPAAQGQSRHRGRGDRRGLEISGDCEEAFCPGTRACFCCSSEANLRAGRVDEALQDLDTGIGMNPSRSLAIAQSAQHHHEPAEMVSGQECPRGAGNRARRSPAADH